jgi:hypothetical protein
MHSQYQSADENSIDEESLSMVKRYFSFGEKIIPEHCACYDDQYEYQNSQAVGRISHINCKFSSEVSIVELALLIKAYLLEPYVPHAASLAPSSRE